MPDADQPENDTRPSNEAKELAGETNDMIHQTRGRPVADFSHDLHNNPDYAKETAAFKAIVTAYAEGVTVNNICALFGITRTDVHKVIELSGARRGYDVQITANDVANLYALLYAAQLEIESLRRQLRHDDDL